MKRGPTTKRDNASRRPAAKATHEPGTAGAGGSDKGFQDRLMGMLEWLADKDPVRAARLIGDYLDDLTEELGAPKSPKPAKG